MKFTQEKKTEWINWLRDNPDLQGKGALRDKQGKYCCLGGYCLLNADEVFGHFEKQEDSGISFFVIDIRQSKSFLPFDLAAVKRLCKEILNIPLIQAIRDED